MTKLSEEELSEITGWLDHGGLSPETGRRLLDEVRRLREENAALKRDVNRIAADYRALPSNASIRDEALEEAAQVAESNWRERNSAYVAVQAGLHDPGQGVVASTIRSLRRGGGK